MTYLVETEECARWVEGAAYSSGGWVTVTIVPLPIWSYGPPQTLVTACWQNDVQTRVHQRMKEGLPPHIRPL